MILFTKFHLLPLRQQRVTDFELSISARRVNKLRFSDERRLDFAFSVLFFNQRLQLPLGNNYTHTERERRAHTFVQSVPSLECSPMWRGQTLQRGGVCVLTLTLGSVNQGARCGPGMTLGADKHPLSDSAPRASVYHKDAAEVEFCCTLLTSIVFQRQPPGGKQGKQLIHPHSAHKQTV